MKTERITWSHEEIRFESPSTPFSDWEMKKRNEGRIKKKRTIRRKQKKSIIWQGNHHHPFFKLSIKPWKAKRKKKKENKEKGRVLHFWRFGLWNDRFVDSTERVNKIKPVLIDDIVNFVLLQKLSVSIAEKKEENVISIFFNNPKKREPERYFDGSLKKTISFL